jgi:hypothetical protein
VSHRGSRWSLGTRLGSSIRQSHSAGQSHSRHRSSTRSAPAPWARTVHPTNNSRLLRQSANKGALATPAQASGSTLLPLPPAAPAEDIHRRGWMLNACSARRWYRLAASRRLTRRGQIRRAASPKRVNSPGG